MEPDFLSKARDTLLAAQILLEKELYDSCANRAYYAAFQAALAAIASVGIKAEKSEHKWVQATFNSELLHKRKLFDSRFKTYLLDLQRIRNRADYTNEKIGFKIASRQLSKAKAFVEIITLRLQP
ncbi:MAG: HEPN domain-containing protein [candidate division KSB1 bacterium]